MCTAIAKIHDRQFNFFAKVSQFTLDDAIVKLMIDRLAGSTMVLYYENLCSENGNREKIQRAQRILSSPNSMCRYYCELQLHTGTVIYTSMLSDFFRVIISRWRLSNHRLKIEVGRYTKPKTPRTERLYDMCLILEDEHHVIFFCP